MKILAIILFSVLVITASAQSIATLNTYLKTSKQILLVKPLSSNSIHGTMFLYEQKNNRKKWKLFDSFPVVVGRNGLAESGETKIPLKDSSLKHEGDGKSPAGIFKLGAVFSYHDVKKLKMPFVQVDTNFYCVDDATSSYYNTLIKQDTAKHNFNSFEYMKRNDDLYEYGVWVLYNSDPIIAGNGSCIFLHIWRNENSGTAGCTAMAKENMLKLIRWLDKKKNPVLLQGVEGKVE